MLRIMNYASPESLDEAYALLTKNKKNMILGGMIWLKMEDIQIPTAIDLSKLGLDQIEEDDTEFKIGAMVTLRQLYPIYFLLICFPAGRKSFKLNVGITELYLNIILIELRH